MRVLKLTILVEPGTKSELINVFGNDYVIVGNRVKFLQYNFPNIKMFTKFKLEPIIQLISTYEKTHDTLMYYMFHLKDDKDSTFSPVYFGCMKGVWSMLDSKTGTELQSSNSLFNLI